MADKENFQGVVESLLKGMDTVLSTKTVVGEATQVARNKVYTENACTEGYYEEADRFGRFLDCNRYAFYADYPQSSGWSDHHRSVVVCRL